MQLRNRAILQLGLYLALFVSGVALPFVAGATVPASPPALPTPVYTGATHAAIIGKTTSARVVDNLFLATTLAQLFMREIPMINLGGRATIIDETLNGPFGGSVQLQGRITGPTSGWLVETFSNYGFGAKSSRLIANGSVLIEHSGSKTTYGWKGYHVTGEGTDFRYDGTVTDTLGAPGARISNNLLMNFSAKDNLRHAVQNYTDFRLLNYGSGTLTRTTLSGRVYNQSLGYVDVVTKAYLYFQPSKTLYYPIMGGEVVAKGAGVAEFHIAPLNHYLFSVGIDPTGTGAVIEAARFAWSTGAPDTMVSADGSPVAVAKQTDADDALFRTGSAVTLDGRFSHSPTGAFLTYSWSLRQAPLGSSATFSSSVTAATAIFTPDVPGDYLIELDVSDGTHTAHDVAIVSAATPAAWPNTFLSGDGGYKMDPVATGTVGVEVKLDGRDTTIAAFPAGAYGDHGGIPTYSWTLTGPAGSATKLSGASTATPHFVPDVPGYYIVTLRASPQFQWIDFGTHTEVIAVDSDLKFDPGLRLTVSDFHPDPYAVTDLDGDGAPDIVATVTDAMGVTSGLYVYHNAGGGQFIQIATSAFTDTPNGVAVGDLDGDGRADIAVGFATEVEVWLQNADGSFASPLTLTYTNACSPFPLSHVDIVRLVTAGANSLVAQGCAGLVVWNYDSGFGSPSVLTLASGTGNGMGTSTFADLSGDGNLDALAVGESGFVWGTYMAAGDGTGAFGTPSLVTGGQVFDVADLDGDTHPDLLALPVGSSQHSINIYMGSSSGLAASPVSVALGMPTLGSSAPIAGDVNGDGRVDLLVPATDDGSLTYSHLGILEQQQDGSFGAEVLYPFQGKPTVVDLNGDGIPDVVTFVNGLVLYLGHP